MPAPYVINSLYNFSTFANTVLGSTFNKVKLVAIMDYYSASKERNVDILHRQVSPFLPPGTPLDITNYTFYKFKTESGQFVILANYWIDTANTQTVVSTLNATFTINDITETDIPILVEQLRLLGYAPITAITYT